MTYIEEMHTRFYWGNMRERDHLENTGINGIILKMDLQEMGLGGGGGMN